MLKTKLLPILPWGQQLWLTGRVVIWFLLQQFLTWLFKARACAKLQVSWHHAGRQWLTMRWMCCRAGVWGCGFPLWGCVWAGSGWGPWVGLEPGLRSPLAWICSIDSEPSSASVLPDPIFPGKPDTAHSLWLSSRESPGPTAPWRRSRRSRRQPELCNYWGRSGPGVLVQCDLWKLMINTHHMLRATFWSWDLKSQ